MVLVTLASRELVAQPIDLKKVIGNWDSPTQTPLAGFEGT